MERLGLLCRLVKCLLEVLEKVFEGCLQTGDLVDE